ncbi:MAG TPA: DnaJ domain-containing protein, partial [Thermodesulfobacteriota bacterium]|nr:DnaJ domain-containing protein [Thermodesulfobacteriota bacterium]
MESQDRKEEKLLAELETMYQRVAESEKSEGDSMQKDALQSYYESLQISPDAPLEKIKETYERLVAFWQPDQFADTSPLRQEAERKLAEITHAYEKILALRQRESRRPFAEPPQEISEAPDRSTPDEETGRHFPWGQILLGGAAFVAVLLAAFFWPTLYHYATIPSGDRTYQIRTNRLTGSVTYFDGANWINLPVPVGQPS